VKRTETVTCRDETRTWSTRDTGRKGKGKGKGKGKSTKRKERKGGHMDGYDYWEKREDDVEESTDISYWTAVVAGAEETLSAVVITGVRAQDALSGVLDGSEWLGLDAAVSGSILAISAHPDVGVSGISAAWARAAGGTVVGIMRALAREAFSADIKAELTDRGFDFTHTPERWREHQGVIALTSAIADCRWPDKNAAGLDVPRLPAPVEGTLANWPERAMGVLNPVLEGVGTIDATAHRDATRTALTRARDAAETMDDKECEAALASARRMVAAELAPVSTNGKDVSGKDVSGKDVSTNGKDVSTNGKSDVTDVTDAGADLLKSPLVIYEDVEVMACARVLHKEWYGAVTIDGIDDNGPVRVTSVGLTFSALLRSLRVDVAEKLIDLKGLTARRRLAAQEAAMDAIGSLDEKMDELAHADRVG
jgi:hypothetical protein